jgi:hypothetical protein
VQSQRGGDILRMRAFPDLIHRPDTQRLKRLVIKLPAVVIAHGTILPDHKIKVRLLSNSLICVKALRDHLPHLPLRVGCVTMGHVMRAGAP